MTLTRQVPTCLNREKNSVIFFKFSVYYYYVGRHIRICMRPAIDTLVQTAACSTVILCDIFYFFKERTNKHIGGGGGFESSLTNSARERAETQRREGRSITQHMEEGNQRRGCCCCPVNVSHTHTHTKERGRRRRIILLKNI